jgi:hypothetical protein
MNISIELAYEIEETCVASIVGRSSEVRLPPLSANKVLPPYSFRIILLGEKNHQK